MNRLWKATALLAKDPKLREELTGVARLEALPDEFMTEFQLPEFMRYQPAQASIQEIDQRFRAQGLILCFYDLAEVNRWLASDRDDLQGEVSKALDDYWTVVGTLEQDVPEEHRTDFLEAAGMFLLDTTFRERYISNNTFDLSSEGYRLSEEEQASLRLALATEAAASSSAAFRKFWGGNSCASVKEAYPGLLHVSV